MSPHNTLAKPICNEPKKAIKVPSARKVLLRRGSLLGSRRGRFHWIWLDLLFL